MSKKWFMLLWFILFLTFLYVISRGEDIEKSYQDKQMEELFIRDKIKKGK